MKRPADLSMAFVQKRARFCCQLEECSSAPPGQCGQEERAVLQLSQATKQQLAPALEHALERTLCDADSALNLTLHAMQLATQIYECGAADAADRALSIAEQALAATVQQLARAQALVVHKAAQQVQQQVGGLHAAAEEEDADLQDTCSSSYSACSCS